MSTHYVESLEHLANWLRMRVADDKAVSTLTSIADCISDAAKFETQFDHIDWQMLFTNALNA